MLDSFSLFEIAKGLGLRAAVVLAFVRFAGPLVRLMPERARTWFALWVFGLSGVDECFELKSHAKSSASMVH